MFFKMEHCDVYYGQIQALYDINVEINPGEIISIIGANGAGKTTLMKSIMGLVPAKNGKIVWQDPFHIRASHPVILPLIIPQRHKICKTSQPFDIIRFLSGSFIFRSICAQKID